MTKADHTGRGQVDETFKTLFLETRIIGPHFAAVSVWVYLRGFLWWAP